MNYDSGNCPPNPFCDHNWKPSGPILRIWSSCNSGGTSAIPPTAPMSQKNRCNNCGGVADLPISEDE